MDLGLKCKRVLVVGGSGHIGLAVGRRFMAEGAETVLAARTASALDRSVAILAGRPGPGRISSLGIDITDTASVSQGVEEASQRLGGLDVLVSVAGAPASPVIANSVAEADAILSAIDVKAMGYLRCARAATPHLLDSSSGRIINVCGQHAHTTHSMTATVRNVSLAAISNVLADELCGSGVTVNVVHPGPVVAETNPSQPPAVGSPGPTDAETVAAVVAFLASPIASTISGASIDVGHRVRGLLRV